MLIVTFELTPALQILEIIETQYITKIELYRKKCILRTFI